MDYNVHDIVLVGGSKSVRAFIITEVRSDGNYGGIMLTGKGKRYRVPGYLIESKVGTADPEAAIFKGQRKEGEPPAPKSKDEWVGHCESMAHYGPVEDRATWAYLATLNPGDIIHFRHRPEPYTFMEVLPRSPKYPIIARNQGGTEYKFMVPSVKVPVAA